MAEDRGTSPDFAPRPVQLAKLYAQPIPIKTFPLPSFYPSNPISWAYVAYTWLNHVLFPPPPEPAVVHQGVWNSATRSVNVRDPESMQALWRQGFFGKGSLSRSEATWLRREKTKRGLIEDDAAEFWTLQRREERESAKWERGRSEQEVIDRQRREEAEQQTAPHVKAIKQAVGGVAEPEMRTFDPLTNGVGDSHGHTSLILPPIGPLELLALPNSYAELSKATSINIASSDASSIPPFDDASDVTASLSKTTNSDDNREGTNGITSMLRKEANSSPVGANGHIHPTPLKRRKSVRFSPNVESTTFQHSDPPSPNRSASSLVKVNSIDVSDETRPAAAQANGSFTSGTAQISDKPPERTKPNGDLGADIPNKEHLQLAPVEAFWLVYAIGALSVIDSDTQKAYHTEELFNLFRQYSYFPPRISPGIHVPLPPDDPFILDLVCYCHLRAIGWIPRPGIKFGVDWLAYKRGVVFEHAEFGIILMPAYTDPWWKTHPAQTPRKTWSWLHGVNRVLSHVYKSLVLMYIEVPPPHAIEEQSDSITSILQQYRVREVMVKRWSPNRNRG